MTKRSADFALNEQIPLERQQFNEAAAHVVRLFEEAKRFDDACKICATSSSSNLSRGSVFQKSESSAEFYGS